MSKKTFASNLGAAALVFLGSASASRSEGGESLSSRHSPPLVARRVVIASSGSHLTLEGYTYAEAVAFLDDLDATGAIPIEYIEGPCPGLVGVEHPAHNEGLSSPRFYCYATGTRLIAPPRETPGP